MWSSIGVNPIRGKMIYMASDPIKTRRYNLVLPELLFDELKTVADKNGTTVVDLMRRYVKLGLLADRLEEIPNAGLFIKEGDSMKQIIIF